MPYPSPFSSSYLLSYGVLISLAPKFCIADSFRPSDIEDLAKTFVDEGLDFLVEGIGYSPGF